MLLGSDTRRSANGSLNEADDLPEDVVRGYARIKANELLGTFEMIQDDQDELRATRKAIKGKLLPNQPTGDDMNVRNTFLGDVTLTNEQFGKIAQPQEPEKPRPTSQLRMGMVQREAPVSAPASQPTATEPAGTPAWKKWLYAGLAGATLAGVGVGGYGLAKWNTTPTEDTDTRNTIRFPADDPDTEKWRLEPFDPTEPTP